MRKVYGFWKVVVVDALGVMFMVAALLTGWLPGPGGVPLFIIGLSLLSINHKWAERYITLLRQHADRLGDYVFVKDARVQVAYDAIGPLLVAVGVFLLVRHSAVWTTSLGVSGCFLGIAVILGNHGRWAQLRRRFRRKR